MCVLYLKNEAKVMFVYQNQKGGDDVSKNSCAREMDERGGEGSIEEAKKEKSRNPYTELPQMLPGILYVVVIVNVRKSLAFFTASIGSECVHSDPDC